MTIELNIEELILNHVDPADQRQVARILESELQHLFQANGGYPAGNAGNIDALNLQIMPGGSPHSIGKQLAHSIYNGLTQQK